MRVAQLADLVNRRRKLLNHGGSGVHLAGALGDDYKGSPVLPCKAAAGPSPSAAYRRCLDDHLAPGQNCGGDRPFPL